MKARNIDEDEDEDMSNIPPFTSGLPLVDEEIENFDDDDVSHLLRSDINPIFV